MEKAFQGVKQSELEVKDHLCQGPGLRVFKVVNSLSPYTLMACIDTYLTLSVLYRVNGQFKNSVFYLGKYGLRNPSIAGREGPKPGRYGNISLFCSSRLLVLLT
jgi:hypothetical protein